MVKATRQPQPLWQELQSGSDSDWVVQYTSFPNTSERLTVGIQQVLEHAGPVECRMHCFGEKKGRHGRRGAGMWLCVY